MKGSFGRFSSSTTTSSCFISCSFFALILFKDNPDVRFFADAIPFSNTILGFGGSTNCLSSGFTFCVSFLEEASTGFLTGIGVIPFFLK